ncbi:hypothetical protein [Paenirhodobacter sp. CAU 1674]|uniref:hypothetical protein n=1 Tax=Paenirhodobacter sp. CAU 1674 TaxID=3032596 RepID=UPI0023D982D5|nr:hypothetical protein [Paenirhodobacter sp. CAU 1674]MDF2142920.1 hypothetical protein [Paenirhodobacter sp. CAU 1674]
MNKENATFWDKLLPITLMEAARDPLKWGDALELIMRMSGAKAAMITLRDRSSCQIVNDVELERKYHSPLIRGFSTEAIVYYLTELRTIDPWAEFQKTCHPHHPTQMSKVCPQDRIADRRFLDWLRTVGFQDSVVFELDRVAGYWTALNLFVERPDTPEAHRVLDFAHENFDLIRSAWVTSQTLSRSRQSNAGLLDRAAGMGAPICIVGANGELLENNALFGEVLASGIIRLSGRDRRLSFSRTVRVSGLIRWDQSAFLRHEGDEDEMVVLASRLDPDPIFAGKRESHWILTCGAKGGASAATGSHLDVLTRQERDLYLGITQGKSVAQAGEAIGLKRSRSFDVWGAVKDKLGLKSAHQLR